MSESSYHSTIADAPPVVAPMASPPRRVLLGVLLIAILAAVAYSPALRGGFIWDDDTFLTNNTLLRLPDGIYRCWFTSQAPDFWPMTYSSFWLEWRLWGTNPTGYHVTNLLLHVASALILWRILSLLSIPGAFLAALLFTVHPLNVETVAWIAQRKSTLAMLFFLLSVLSYLRTDELQAENENENSQMGKVQPRQRPPLLFSATSLLTSPGLWYLLSLLAFVLAMLSKGSVATLPCIILGIVGWRHGRITRHDIRQIIPFIVVAAALTLVNIWFQTHGSSEIIRTGSFAQRLTGAGAVAWFYLASALLPINLMFVYPNWNIQANHCIWWMPLGACIALTIVLWQQRIRQWVRPLLFAWGYFCLALAPVMGFTYVYFMKYSLVADHYAYSALVAVVALVAAALNHWRCTARGSARLAPITAATLLIAICSLLTYRQCLPYSDIIHLYRASLQQNPASEMLHDNLGIELSKLGNHREAIEHFEAALRLEPDDCEVHNNLGLELIDIGRSDEGLKEIHESLRIDPKFALGHDSLGRIFLNSGRFDEAIREYRQALEINPRLAASSNDLGVALLKTGHADEAFYYFGQAVAIRPDYLEAQTNMALALLSAGFADAALEHLQQALQLNPNDFRLWAESARAHALLNQVPEAVSAAEQAVSLARSAGREDLAQKLTNWLNKYRAAPNNVPEFPSPRNAVNP